MRHEAELERAVSALRDSEERHRSLLQRIAGQTRELAEANSRLRELDELKTNFVVTASHELRTPLTAVIGFMATLGERWNELDERERREFVQTAERQGRRMLRLVEDLHALSRIDEGELQTRTMAVELAPVLGRAVAVFRSTGTDVDLDVRAGLRVDADSARVQQILGNLIANAIKYGAPPISVDARLDGTTIVIRVRDEGPGVPRDLHSRLFERFARSAQQEDRVQPGFGLGLATARELARSMHGDLWYWREGDGGTTFCLRLPKAPSLATHGSLAPLQGIRGDLIHA